VGDQQLPRAQAADLLKRRRVDAEDDVGAGGDVALGDLGPASS